MKFSDVFVFVFSVIVHGAVGAHKNQDAIDLRLGETDVEDFAFWRELVEDIGSGSLPTVGPSSNPAAMPSLRKSAIPSDQPSIAPSSGPSPSPTVSSEPSK